MRAAAHQNASPSTVVTPVVASSDMVVPSRARCPVSQRAGSQRAGSGGGAGAVS
jgi:hypothetical protein